jgi:hypothetical protein
MTRKLGRKGDLEMQELRKTVKPFLTFTSLHRSPSPFPGWKPLKNRHFIRLVNGFTVAPFQTNQVAAKVWFSPFSLHRFLAGIYFQPSPAFTVSQGPKYQLHKHEGETVHRFPVFQVKAGKFLTLETVTGWKPLKETVRKGDLERVSHEELVKTFLTFPAFTLRPSPSGLQFPSFTVSPFHPFPVSRFHPFTPSPHFTFPAFTLAVSRSGRR